MHQPENKQQPGENQPAENQPAENQPGENQPAQNPTCRACGRSDNDSGLFVWIATEDDALPFCPGPCINALLDHLRDQGLHEQADALQLSITEQLTGGWRDNVRLLEEHPGTGET